MDTIEVGTFDAALADLEVDAVLLPVFSDADAALPWPEFDAAVDGRLSAALASRPFTGKVKSVLAVPLAAGDGPAEALLVGLGDASSLEPAVVREALARGANAATRRRAERIAVAARDELGATHELAAAACEAVLLGQYRFTRYKRPDGDSTALQTLLLPAGSGVDAAIDRARSIATAVTWARDLINLSPSDKRPPALAAAVATMADEVGLACEVIDEARATELNLGALLAVARGSSTEARMVVLEHRPDTEHGGAGGEPPEQAPVLLVGKGVTFDTGGISIKPSATMDEMKADMSGAAAVVATMRAIAQLDLPRRVVAVVPMAENMPDGNAYRPGDLVTAMNGKVIEVLNTDAEGRLILADALAYGVRKFAPCCVVDLATLTGACVVALGQGVAGLMTNDDPLGEQLVAAGRRVAEPVWPLPMFDEYDELIESKVGDIKNTGGRWGGAITAAKFLQNFVDDTPWVHLDIAGPAYRAKARPLTPRGGAGFGVRLLVDWLSHEAGC